MSVESPSAAARVAAPGWFLLTTCCPGAEAALVARQQAVMPALRRAAWRRGVVTFRVADSAPADDLAPDLVFARACVRSLGQVTGVDDQARAAAALALAGTAPWEAVHVWKRDERIEADTAVIGGLLAAGVGIAAAGGTARPGGLVLDCVVDAPDRWWIGRHRATAPPGIWPGGVAPTTLPDGCVSRAWLKLDEAIAVFGLRLEPGQRAIELGAAPGGACQRLLEAGLEVTGVDPALVDPRVVSHPRFRQWRMRARDVKRQAFRGYDWLVCDMNIDPTSTMTALEGILTAPGVRPVGVIATLKLPTWSRAEALPAWLDAFTAWGYVPRARQLATGGRELCVAAVAHAAAGGGSSVVRTARASRPRAAGGLRPRRARRRQAP
jgi:23S rRNA (cytidine2498-2'-O)-methyltransferase